MVGTQLEAACVNLSAVTSRAVSTRNMRHPGWQVLRAGNRRRYLKVVILLSCCWSPVFVPPDADSTDLQASEFEM